MLNNLIHTLESQPLLFIAAIFIFSLMVGSFLNVVILRYPIILFRGWLKDVEYLKENTPNHQAIKNLSEPYTLSTPPSQCPNCNTPIKYWHNIPIFSYLALKGSCSGCLKNGSKTKISPRYPLIEIATALLSLVVLAKFSWSIPLVPLLFLTWILIALSMIDIDYQILPDSMTYLLLWVGLLLSTQSIFSTPIDSITGAASGYALLWIYNALFKLFTKEDGMGAGDFKLMAALGAWFGLNALMPILFMSFLLAGLFASITGLKKERAIPFGPSIAISGWVYAIFNTELDCLWVEFLSW